MAFIYSVKCEDDAGDCSDMDRLKNKTGHCNLPHRWPQFDATKINEAGYTNVCKKTCGKCTGKNHTVNNSFLVSMNLKFIV